MLIPLACPYDDITSDSEQRCLK